MKPPPIPLHSPPARISAGFTGNALAGNPIAAATRRIGCILPAEIRQDERPEMSGAGTIHQTNRNK